MGYSDESGVAPMENATSPAALKAAALHEEDGVTTQRATGL
jgi:hypothetical protein